MFPPAHSRCVVAATSWNSICLHAPTSPNNRKRDPLARSVPPLLRPSIGPHLNSFPKVAVTNDHPLCNGNNSKVSLTVLESVSRHWQDHAPLGALNRVLPAVLGERGRHGVRWMETRGRPGAHSLSSVPRVHSLLERLLNHGDISVFLFRLLASNPGHEQGAVWILEQLGQEDGGAVTAPG